MSDINSQNSLDQQRSYFASVLFGWLCAFATFICVAALIGLLASIFYRGSGWLSWTLITSLSSSSAEESGVYVAIVGSLYIITLTALFSVPIGVGCAVYLEEYSANTWWRKLVQLNISNLAGVPSIVYGILGLGLFVRAMHLERSVLAGAMTLSLVVLPIVILAAQEALRAVPGTIRQASYALGATRWQTVWHQVLPAALPGMMTGVILAIARALGEAAPLVLISGIAYMNFAPQSVFDKFTVMPLIIYNWASLPQEEFHELASAAIILLLFVLIIMNAGAVWVRSKYGKRIKW